MEEKPDRDIPAGSRGHGPSENLDPPFFIFVRIVIFVVQIAAFCRETSFV